MIRSARFWASLAIILSCLTMAQGEEPTLPAPPAVESTLDFDKTYRLEFKLVNSDNSQSYIVLTSQSKFAIRYGVHKDGEEFGFDLAGNLAVLKEGERVRVSFKMSIDRTSVEGNSFDLSSSGSAIVTLGKSKTVAKYGGYDLVLVATVDEDDEGDEAESE